MHRLVSSLLVASILAFTPGSSPAAFAEPLRLGLDATAGLGAVVYTGASLRLEVGAGTPRGFLVRAGYARGFEPIKEGDDVEAVALALGYRSYDGRFYAGFEGGLLALRRSPNDLAEPEKGDDGAILPLLTLGVNFSLPALAVGLALGFELSL